MAILSKGTTYATGDQVTASGLNALVDSATFASGAVDGSTTALSGGAIIVKDGGVTMAKLASASNGQIPIGNGSGYTAATLTGGTNIGITNASGSVTVAFSGTLPIANGGTGATTAADAKVNLGLGVPVKNTSQLDRTDNTYTDIPGLTLNLVSGTTYTVETIIPFSAASASTTGFKVTGTATGSSVGGISFIGYSNGGSTGSLLTKSITAIPTTVTCSISNQDTGYLHSSITIVCNGSGTIKWQFAGNTGTSSVLLGATMKLFSY